MKLAIVKLNRHPYAVMAALHESDLCRTMWLHMAALGYLYPWGKVRGLSEEGLYKLGCFLFANLPVATMIAENEDLWEYITSLGTWIGHRGGREVLFAIFPGFQRGRVLIPLAYRYWMLAKNCA